MEYRSVQNISCNSNAAWFPSITQPDNIPAQELPFSFTYNDKHSSDWLSECKLERSSREIDRNRREHTLIFTDDITKLVLKCVAVEYLDYPTVEWTLYFQNNGQADTPIIENIQALDIHFSKDDAANEFVLHHSRGTLVTTIDVPAGQRDYEPLTTVLRPGINLQFVPPQGRPTAGEFPYYNLQWQGGGAIIVVGWPGAWAARFERDGDNGLRISAGQQRTHFILHPKEEVRSPRIVVQRYQGDWIDAQNTWRKWMIDHNMPRPGGKPIEPMTGGFDGYYFPNLTVTQNGEKHYIDRYKEERLVPDCWWVDAGWYQMTDDTGTTSYVLTGTWEVEKKRFPEGLRPVFDYAKSKGIGKGILWFEPERVAPGRWLYEKHPEWLLGREGQYKLLNLGNPDAREWVINMVDKTMNDAGITIYREDFNFGPLDCWTCNEPEDRQGINEIKHVTGHLEFWKELLRRDPDRMIDTCASGGHRLDLETLRLSVPLWRTDCPNEPIGTQSQTYGLSMWIPYSGTGTVSDDPYVMRSNMTPFFLMSWDMDRKDINFDRLRKLMTEWRNISAFYQGDFYPLTDYSVADTVWMAWQFNRKDMNAGVIQVFRRDKSPYETARFKLRGLDPLSKYKITNVETRKSIISAGKNLMDSGIPITIKDKPYAVTYIYAKQ